MKAASLSEIKKDMGSLSQKEVLELCLKLAKYKKENKELLTYLLYESSNEEGYVMAIKEEVDEQFQEINYNNIYYSKKGFRKVLRMVNKYIRYSGLKTTEIELLIYYCKKLKNAKVSIQKSAQMLNLYQRQLDKITKAVSGLHEDLQYDYEQEIDSLSI